MTDAERELCRNASPVTYISPDDPPALILHGTNDALVPVEQSQILFDHLNESGVPAELHIIEGAPRRTAISPSPSVSTPTPSTTATSNPGTGFPMHPGRGAKSSSKLQLSARVAKSNVVASPCSSAIAPFACMVMLFW